MPEDDDALEDTSNTSSFFSPVEGVSYHANSFMELNLSRPLIRACEALEFKKPFPIQVFSF